MPAMMSTQRILDHFRESADIKLQAGAQLALPISQAVELMFAALSNGNKILACGNGGAAALCQYFAAALIGRFERERLPLPALALTSNTSVLTGVTNEYSYRETFAKQAQAFGQPGDVLLVISSSGNSDSLSAAVEVALEREMRVVALTGGEGGNIARQLTDLDVHISVQHERNARVQELHLLALHCLCDGIDTALFGGESDE